MAQKTFDTLMLTLSIVEAGSALANLTGGITKSKVDACTALAREIDGGRLTLAQVYAAAGKAPAAQPTAQPRPQPATSNAPILAAEGAAKAAQAAAIAAATDAAQTQATVRDLADEVRKVAERVEQVSKAKATVQVDLSGIDQQVQARIEQAFGPFKSAVEGAGAQQVVADLIGTRVIRTDRAADVFDGMGGDLPVDIWNSPDAPAIDPCYVWQESILRHLLQSQATGENLWIGGEKGAGKTQAVQQFCARTGRAFVRVNFHKTSAAEEFIGAVGIEAGATVFKDGPVLRAMSTPGAVCLLDEPTNAHEGELAFFNALLEPNTAVTIGDKVRTRAPGMLFVAADNTLGSGDPSGLYVGTRQMNASLMDRFARAVPVTFLPRDVEVAAIVKHTGCSEALAQRVVDVMAVCRTKVQSGDLVTAPSIRQAVAFIRALKYHPVPDAWNTAIAAKQPVEGLVALQAVYSAHVNATELQSLI